MKTNTNLFGFVTNVTKPRLLATVNSFSKIFSLLPITLAVLFLLKSTDVKSQGVSDSITPMFRQFEAKSAQFDKMFDDKSGDRLIFTYVKDVTVLKNKGLAKDLYPGTRVLFMNKQTGNVSTDPVLLYAKHVFMYDNKLFYIKDSTRLYSYDLVTSEVKLLVTTNSRIMFFYNMTGDRVLISIRNSGSANMQEANTINVTRLAVYNYNTGEIKNITDLPNIYQAFNIGEKIVFFESGYWFNKPGIRFRANTYDPVSEKLYSRTDFNALGLCIPTSDSTFILWYNPAEGGAYRMTVVNVNKNLVGSTFTGEDIFKLAGFWAPPVAGMNGDADPASPTVYFMNNERVVGGAWWFENLKNGIVNQRVDEEIWATNLLTFKEVYIGRFYDQLRNYPIYSGARFDDRFASFNETGFYTTKLYGETGAIKSAKIDGVKVYPNPSSNGFTTIDVPENANVEIYSVDGRMTFSQKVSFGNTEIPINSGVNVIKIEIGSNIQTVKVIGY
jgi:hypothetical protein